LSFSQRSQTQPGFLRTASFNGITCEILQSAGGSREPLWLGTSPFDDSTSFQEGHLQRFTGELSERTGLGMRHRESKVIAAVPEQALVVADGGTRSPTAWAEGLTGLGAGQTRCAP